jgi:hypothetical protein
MNNAKPPTFITQMIFKPWMVLVLLSLVLLVALAFFWLSPQNAYQGLYCTTKLNTHETRNKAQVEAMLDVSVYFKDNDKVTFSLYGVIHDGTKSSVVSRNLDYHYEQDGKFLLLTDPVVRKSGTDNAADDAITFGEKQTLRVEQLLDDDILVSTTFIPVFVCSRKEHQRDIR